MEFLSEGNKVRTDLTRIYSDLQPQLTGYLSKGEKRKKKGKSTAYLTEIKKRVSGPKAGSQKSGGVEDNVGEAGQEES